MVKATEIFKLDIMDIKSGKERGKASNILYHQEDKELYLTLEGKHPGDIQILPTKDIKGIGEDYILIEESSVIKDLLDSNIAEDIKESQLILGAKVVGATGDVLGEITDIELDEQQNLVGLLLSGEKEISSNEIISVCLDIVFVGEGQSKNTQNPSRISKDEEASNLGKEELSIKETSIKALQDIENEPDELVENELAKNRQIKASSEESEDLLGLVLKEDLISEDGELELKKGSLITEEVLALADEHDVLLKLAMIVEAK